MPEDKGVHELIGSRGLSPVQLLKALHIMARLVSTLLAQRLSRRFIRALSVPRQRQDTFLMRSGQLERHRCNRASLGNPFSVSLSKRPSSGRAVFPD